MMEQMKHIPMMLELVGTHPVSHLEDLSHQGFGDAQMLGEQPLDLTKFAQLHSCG